MATLWSIGKIGTRQTETRGKDLGFRGKAMEKKYWLELGSIGIETRGNQGLLARTDVPWTGQFWQQSWGCRRDRVQKPHSR